MNGHDEPGAFFRLSCDGAEVCWGESLGGGKARVANPTGRDDYRLGDVVEYAVHGETRTITRRLGSLVKFSRPA